MRCLLGLLLLSCCCLHLHAAGESESESEAGKTPCGCAISHPRLYRIFESLFSEGLELYVNCLSFDLHGALVTGVLSGVNMTSGVSGPGSERLVLSCVEEVITVRPSLQTPLAVNMTSTACLTCEDIATPCDGDCVSPCERCYGAPGSCSRCLACVDLEQEHCYVGEGGTDVLARGTCDSTCDDAGRGTGLIAGGVVNPERFNLCECPEGYFRQLVAYPPARELEEEDTCDFFPPLEPFRCVRQCQAGFDPFENETCYACGLDYCLECDRTVLECSLCLRNTVLFEHECFACPLAVVALNAIEQEHEREEEIEDQELRQIELAVSLPILTVFVILVFLGMTLFAHYRYPHLNPRGHKRHRTKPEDFDDATVEIVSEEGETANPDVWRARPTVRYR